MKYSKELHERVRQNLRMFDYPRFDDGDIDCLLDEIERLQAERRWIPVSEKLPNDWQNVLAYSDAIHTAIYFKKDFVGSAGYLPGVTHWMPLPPPPEDK